MTDADLQAAIGALQSFIEAADGWLEEMAVPAAVYGDGAALIIQQWDAVDHSGDNPDNLATLKACIGFCLYQKIAGAGYGAQTSQEQCTLAAAAVLAAVLAQRGRSTGASPS